MIGLDPGYRTADEGELKLLREEILEELLEEAYEQRDEAFSGTGGMLFSRKNR